MWILTSTMRYLWYQTVLSPVGNRNSVYFTNEPLSSPSNWVITNQLKKEYLSELKGREEDLTECFELDFAHMWCGLGVLLCTNQKEYINVAHYGVYKLILVTRQDLKLLKGNLRNILFI